MAFVSVGSFGTANSVVSGTTLALTPTVTLEVGNLAVVIIASDNEGQNIAANELGHFNDLVISVTDTGSNVWRCIGSNSDVRASAGGASVHIFATVITTQLTTGSTITATLQIAKTSKSITSWEFTTGSATFSVSNLFRNYAQAADPPSMSLMSEFFPGPGREYIFIRATASETNSTSWTPTTNYTGFTNATADTGTLGTSMSADGEFRIVVSTGETSNPTKAANDNASVFLSLHEGPPTIPVVVHGNIYQQTTTGQTVLWPRPHEVGDICLIVAECTGGENITLTTANGFAEVTNSPQNTSETKLAVFWCRATSRTMASPVFADPGNHLLTKAFLIRGCIPTGNPWDITVGSANDTPSTSVSITGGTTTVPFTLVLAITSIGTDSVTDEFSSWANASLSDIFELETIQTDIGTGGGFGIGYGYKSAVGTVDATTCTLVTSSDHAKLMIAFKPLPIFPPLPSRVVKERRFASHLTM